MKSPIIVLTVLFGSLLALPLARGDEWVLTPHAALVGGVMHEIIIPTSGDQPGQSVEDHREDRTFTLALSRIGLHGRMPGGFELVSEFEFNSGLQGHGSSVWEGQAALQVRSQLLRFTRWGLRIDAGHVQDDSSVDYTSAHVADQLLSDSFTRYSLLASGYDRGNGVYATYDLWNGLRLGLTFNAGNPTSNTGILVVGGSYQPFERFFEVAVKDLAQDQNTFPRDTMHFLILSPSVTFDHRFVKAQASVQFFSVHHNTETDDVDTIDGRNLRAGLRLSLWQDRLEPFFNVAEVRNNVVNPRDQGKTMPGNDWAGLTFSGGLDLRIYGRSGVGIQYAQVRGQEGDQGTLRIQHFANLGATYFLTDMTSVGLRLGLFRKIDENNDGTTLESGLTGLFLSLRTLI